ncbi:MBL fold metallo-hydrolase [Candidatus Poribacteria bacterium]|nr:MBL fold metallo-hydrolase [Candidatus Poribacteria bacterium]
MIVQPFFVEGLAHSSYLLGGTNTCAIVDPQRDVEIYLNAAKSLDMKITHILETHLHADFVSGHIDLAEKTGAKIYAPKSGECKFNHLGLAEGATFELEDMALSVLETPGHTPEHICYVVTDTARGNDPVGVFTGDTLFVGDVGRPDLFSGKSKKLASSLYDSLHEKLLKLPDFCEVYPAHGAGSLCGRTMGEKRTSTIGYERKYNAALQIKNREEFIKSLTTNMPQAPDHFSRCSAINRNGPALVCNLPRLEALEPEPFQHRVQNENILVLDVRSYDSFGGQHIPGAYHIDLGGNFATFAGWVLPPDAGILLVTDNSEQAKRAVVWLRRVGLDKVIGYLGDGMYAWAKAGLPTEHVGQLSVEELHEMTTGEHKMVLVDVRAPSEYEKLHIEDTINIPVADLRTRYQELEPNIPTVLICSTGRRSSLGTSILKQHGFKEVFNAAGGMTGYSAAGYVTECTVCFIPHGPHFLGMELKLPTLPTLPTINA